MIKNEVKNIENDVRYMKAFNPKEYEGVDEIESMYINYLGERVEIKRRWIKKKIRKCSLCKARFDANDVGRKSTKLGYLNKHLFKYHGINWHRSELAQNMINIATYFNVIEESYEKHWQCPFCKHWSMFNQCYTEADSKNYRNWIAQHMDYCKHNPDREHLIKLRYEKKLEYLRLKKIKEEELLNKEKQDRKEKRESKKRNLSEGY